MHEHLHRASFFFRLIRRYWWLLALIAVALWSWGFYALGAFAVYRAHPELSQSERASQILSKVSRLIQLPQGEPPTMATINNAAQAKVNQPFLASAEDGDVLIVYQRAEEALLYRPSTDKLVAVGPVTNGPQPSVPAATSTNASTTSAKK